MKAAIPALRANGRSSVGECRYCAKTAGFLRQSHKACEQAHQSAPATLLYLFGSLFGSGKDLNEFVRDVSEEVTRGFLRKEEAEAAFRDGIEASITGVDDRPLTQEEAAQIRDLARALGVDIDSDSKICSHLEKAAVLRKIDAGQMPNVKLIGANPFVLTKGEQIAWVFNNVPYYKTKSETHYVGGQRGVSFRLARGVYYHAGTHKGRKVTSVHLVEQCIGDLAVTNKNIYLKSAVQSLRLSLRKIVSIDVLSDGIEIIREAANPKPEVFAVDDPHFAANLLSRLAAN